MDAASSPVTCRVAPRLRVPQAHPHCPLQLCTACFCREPRLRQAEGHVCVGDRPWAPARSSPPGQRGCQAPGWGELRDRGRTARTHVFGQQVGPPPWVYAKPACRAAHPLGSPFPLLCFRTPLLRVKHLALSIFIGFLSPGTH